MSFYLNRSGAPEGPFAEQQIVAMIQRGEVTQGSICAVGHNQWQALTSHPAFAAALAQRGAPGAYGGPAYGQPPAQQAYGAPQPQPGVQPQQAYGAQPQQAYGAQPQQGAPPQQAYGAQPQQAYGAPPQQAYGAPPQQAYGAPPQQAYGAPPQQGYGAPPQQGYGAPPQQAYGAPGYAGAQAVAPGPKKKGKGGLIAIISLLLLLVLGGGAAAAYFFFMGGSGPQIASALPRDTELFFEIPSVKRLALDVHGLDFIDQKSADEKKMIEDATQTLADAFDLSKDDARDLLFSVSSIGGGARKLDKDAEAAVIVGFSSKSAVEALLATKRFTAAGAFGEAGKKYQLSEKKADAAKDAMKQALFAMELGGTKDVLVWFPKKKLLVAGTEALVSDVGKVLEQGAASLEKNETFDKGSKDFGSDARAVAFFDPSIALANADSSAKETIDAYFKSAGPITGAVRMKDAGALFDLKASFTGNKYPKTGMTAPITLDLAKRLPAETFAYIAFMPKANITGAEAEKQVLEQVRAIDKNEAIRTEQQLREMERVLGVTLIKMIDSIGEQAVIGFAAPETFTVDPTRGEKQLMDLAAFAVVKLGDEAPLKGALTKLKEQFGDAIEREATLREESGGFVVTPKTNDMPISLHAKFIDKQLVVAIGSNSLVDKGLKSITSGNGSLAGSGAHEAALGALPPKNHFLMWVDAGRMGDTLMRSPLIKQQIEASGFDVGKLKFTGDQRVTTALSLEVETQNDVWTYRLHALNAPALATVGGAVAAVGAAGAASAFDANPSQLQIGAGTTGLPADLGQSPPTTAADLVVPSTPTLVTGAFKVGDKVDVEWKGKFYPSTILVVLPNDRYKIHYDGWASSWDEVVTSRRIRRK